jgi:hypothetical protein
MQNAGETSPAFLFMGTCHGDDGSWRWHIACLQKGTADASGRGGFVNKNGD